MKIRKLVSVLLAVSLMIQPITVSASTGSISTPRVDIPRPGGWSGNVDLNRLAATYSRWGWRIITFGDTRPIVESNVQPLEGEYSKFINDTFDKGTETKSMISTTLLSIQVQK